MKNKTLQYVLNIVILVGIVLAARRYLNGAEVLAALQTFNYAYAPWILGASAFYMALKAWRFIPLMRPISDVHWGVLFRGYLAGTAATIVPGGVAARAGLMAQAGVPVAESGAPVAYSSILDQFIFVLGSLVAALFFEGARVPALVLLGILGVVGTFMLIPYTRGLAARLANWVADRFNAREKWQKFLESMVKVTTPRIMLIALGITAIGLGVQILILDLSLRGVGQALPYPVLFLAYVLPTMFGRLSVLPAGVGLTEATMVGFLATTSGVDPEVATAASAVYRIATVLFQVLLGALVYFFAWRGEGERDRPSSA